MLEVKSRECVCEAGGRGTYHHGFYAREDLPSGGLDLWLEGWGGSKLGWGGDFLFAVEKICTTCARPYLLSRLDAAAENRTNCNLSFGWLYKTIMRSLFLIK